MYNKVQAGQIALKFICKHKMKLLTFTTLIAIADDLCVRIGREKDQKKYEESSIMQIEVAQKNEAKINILAAQAQEANKKIAQLEQIVKILMKKVFEND